MRSVIKHIGLALCTALLGAGFAVNAAGRMPSDDGRCHGVRVEGASAADIRPDGTGCRDARGLARTFSRWMVEHDAIPTHPAGYHFGRYTCSTREATPRRWRVRCANGNAVVRFAWRRT
jgi:hypothetical protein